MTYSGVMTEHRPTSEQSGRTHPVSLIVLHHAATTNIDQVVAMMMPGGRQVSAHGAFKDGRRIGVVVEEQRAWSLSSPKYDSMALTIEACNSSTGGAWPLSGATHESLAQVVADWSRRYGIPCDRNHVIGHREVYTRYGASYATACPGGMDLEWIVSRAREILGQGATPAPIPSAPASGGGASSGTYNGYPIKSIQQLLTAAGFPTAADGIYGPDTKAKVRAFQAARKLTVDGIAGAATWAALTATGTPSAGGANQGVKDGQTYLNRFGYGLAVDGINGAATKAAVRDFQSKNGLVVDGILGAATKAVMDRKLGGGGASAPAGGNTSIRAVQQALKTNYPLYAGKLVVDGIDGPATKAAVKEFQRRAGLTVDGIVGPQTRKALGI